MVWRLEKDQKFNKPTFIKNSNIYYILTLIETHNKFTLKSATIISNTVKEAFTKFLILMPITSVTWLHHHNFNKYLNEQSHKPQRS